MHSILEITTFYTPVDSLEYIESKEQQIRSMIEDFLINSWNEFTQQNSRNDYYDALKYTLKHISVSISIKHDAKMLDYLMPHCIVLVEIDEGIFEKWIIEDFLNTIIRFFSGTLIRWYFIEYDARYHVEDMNQWKKYSLEDISKIDIENIENSKNKNLLDWILYLYYTLEKQILALGIAKKNIDIYLENDTDISALVQSLSVSKDTLIITAENLLNNIKILHKQILILLWYFTHKK